jgi:DnaJ family protein B protein 12
MESNREEATRCLGIAQKHFSAANYPSARKFAQKSIALFETPEAVKLLAAVNTAASASSNGSASASASTSASAGATGTETHPSAAGAKQRHAAGSSSSKGNGTAGGIGGEKREYTAEQGAVVRRVRGCKVTEYYEILAVKRDCEEAEVKKAYRKVRGGFYFILFYFTSDSFLAARACPASRQERGAGCG